MPELKGTLLREWQELEGTRVFLKDLKEMEQEYKDRWGRRSFEKSDSHEWIVINSAVLGEMRLLDQLIVFIEGEKENEPIEQVGPDADSGQDSGEAQES